MTLHIIPDSVFTDFVINKLNQLDYGNHKFILFMGAVDDKPKHTRYKLDIVSPNEIKSQVFITSLEQYDFIVIHSLVALALKKLVISSSVNIKFVWLGWGGDYYDMITPHKQLFDRKTFNLMNKLYSFKQKLKMLIKTLIRYDIKAIELYKKVEYFSSIVYDEYEMIEKHTFPLHTKYIPFSYGQLENDLLKGIENLHIHDTNILLGNSASYTNNHIEIIDTLKTLNLGNRKIITPLSYGDTKYSNYIMNYGQKHLGSNFKPLVDFLDKEKYNTLLTSCSICIINTRRQQAVGNIITMLYFGSKLFLNEENILYSFFKNSGAVIFSIQEISKEFSSPLKEREIKMNRKVLHKHWGEDAVNKKYLEFIKTVQKGE